MTLHCLEIPYGAADDDQLLGIAETHAMHKAREAPRVQCQFFDLTGNDQYDNDNDTIEHEYEHEWEQQVWFLEVNKKNYKVQKIV